MEELRNRDKSLGISRDRGNPVLSELKICGVRLSLGDRPLAQKPKLSACLETGWYISPAATAAPNLARKPGFFELFIGLMGRVCIFTGHRVWVLTVKDFKKLLYKNSYLTLCASADKIGLWTVFVSLAAASVRSTLGESLSIGGASE